ncbi:hypothetical protein AX761_22650 [Rhizobium sp. 58]|nr:hypothetical protein AX761_22650 [Rhizobium sp. 58]
MSCPCCGYTADKKDPVEISRAIKMSPMERTVFDILARRFSRQMTREFLVAEMYGRYSNGGPDDPWRVLHVITHRLRKKIIPHGLDIVAQKGRGANGISMIWAEA